MPASLLLAWYDRHRRSLPFRGTRDPYRIWVSEIMLQQTRTETVGAYYERFLQRFPDVFALAEAPEEDVLKCWEGLGYYSRARNLHKAAQEVVARYGGRFPEREDLLRALPGVGDYTAAAVASIAFDLPAPAMDGNLTRVLSRFHGVREDVGIPSVRRALLALARQDMPPVRCGDFNQALMDLGATVCTPGTPDCLNCPLSALCDACRKGDAEDLPVKAAAKAPREIPVAVLLVLCRGRVLMTKRREALLRGLWVYFLTESDKREEAEAALRAQGVRAQYRQTLGTARHVFTHRIWNMTLYRYEAEAPDCREGQFLPLRDMLSLPMPTAMRAAREQAVRLLTPRMLPADEGALPSLARVYAESWKSSHTSVCSREFLEAHTPEAMQARLEAHLAAGRDVFGLYIADRAAGVLVIDRKENELTALYVHPDDQGVGAGRAAGAFAVEALDGARPMKVTLLRGNQRALSLYRSLGFTLTAEEKLKSRETKPVQETLGRPAEA